MTGDAVPNTHWFALAARRRRIDLALRKSDIPSRGGPSTPTVYKIESGTGALTPRVLARLDTALGWEPGAAARALRPTIRSMQDVLDAVGHDPTPLHSPVAPALHHDLPASAGVRSSASATGRGWETTSAAFPVTAPTATAKGGVSVGDIATAAASNPARARDWVGEPDTRTPYGRRQQPRAHRTRSLLVAAAAHEITVHGYTAASVNTMLDLVGCSKGALYFHFSCKAELADAVLTAADDLYTTITTHQPTTTIHTTSTGDTAEIIGAGVVAAATEAVHPLAGHPALAAIALLVDTITAAYRSRYILQAETVLLTEPRFRHRRPSRIWESAVTALAHTAADTGALRPPFTAGHLSRAVIAAVTGHCHAHTTLAHTALADTIAHSRSTIDDSDPASAAIDSQLEGAEFYSERVRESIEIIFTAMTSPHHRHPIAHAQSRSAADQ
ncbi:TetR family transcriptional regulator [Rhodococcoides fascians]|uniref:TetR family transcriptional regulator n=1 Tax=Rhodococcoides fascians TaxID=1828 RepID=UPI000691CF0E|nr:TetR family transcriptional regulator [Rhodococcus fascians]